MNSPSPYVQAWWARKPTTHQMMIWPSQRSNNYTPPPLSDHHSSGPDRRPGLRFAQLYAQDQILFEAELWLLWWPQSPELFIGCSLGMDIAVTQDNLLSGLQHHIWDHTQQLWQGDCRQQENRYTNTNPTLSQSPNTRWRHSNSGNCCTIHLVSKMSLL